MDTEEEEQDSADTPVPDQQSATGELSLGLDRAEVVTQHWMRLSCLRGERLRSLRAKLSLRFNGEIAMSKGSVSVLDFLVVQS